MTYFPRTTVGGVSLPRLLIGTNWFLGYSHTSKTKDHFIKTYQAPQHIAAILDVFLEYGIDAIMGPVSDKLKEALQHAEQRNGQATIGTTPPEEARESIEISLDLINRRLPQNELQQTRSKSSLS